MPMIHANDVDSATILPQWTRLAEESLESGHVPAIVLGTGAITPEAQPGLLALSGLDETQTGLANPVALVGGEASLWFLALLQRPRVAYVHSGGAAAQRVQAIQRRVPPALFTGPDMATHSAGLALAAQTLSPGQVRGVSPSTSALPGLAWNLHPTHRTGAISRWDWLPFEAVDPTNSSDPANSADPDNPPPHAPIATTTAYFGLLLALGIVLAALLF